MNGDYPSGTAAGIEGDIVDYINTPGTPVHDALSATIDARALRKFDSGAPGSATQEVFSPVAVRAALKGLYVAGGDHVGSSRQPFGQTMNYDATSLGDNGGDKVAVVNNIVFRGDFTPEWTRPGGAPKWLWGANDFIRLGDGTDGNKVVGITDAWARLSEIHVTSPNQSFTNLHAVIAEGGVDSTGTGATITGWLAPLKASGPTRNATATITNAASIYVTSPAAGVATNQYAIYVGGEEKSRFGGDILMNDNSGTPKTLNAYYGTVRGKYVIAGSTTEAASAMLTAKSAGDSDIVGWFRGRGAQSVNILNVGVDAVVRTFFDKRGRLGMADTSVPADADIANGHIVFYVDSTSGAMKLKLKAKDAGGTVRTGEVALT